MTTLTYRLTGGGGAENDGHKNAGHDFAGQKSSFNRDYITLLRSVQLLVVIFLDTSTLMHCA